MRSQLGEDLAQMQSVTDTVTDADTDTDTVCQSGSHLLPINSKPVGEYDKHSSMCVSCPLLTRSKGNAWHLYQTHVEQNVLF